MTLSVRGRFWFTAAMILAASSVWAQTPSAPSSTGAVLLLAGKDDAASVAQLKAALISPDPSIRATAARVVGTGVYPTLESDLLGALAREQDPDAGAELVRAFLWVGGDGALSIADEQSRRFGQSAVLVLAEWLARTSPQKLVERLPALAAGASDARVGLERVLEMGAGQHPEMVESFENAWQRLENQGGDESGSTSGAAINPKWVPARPVTAALVKPLDPSMMSSLLSASSCKPASDRAGLAGILFRPDGRAARIQLGSENLPPGCVAALVAIARTTVVPETEPVVAGQVKYIIAPFTDSFAACTAALERHPATQGLRPGSSPGKITVPRKTHDVRPVFPPAAQKSGIQGTVLIEADVTPQGCIAGAHVIKSVRGLDVAALWAVSQWQYTPTLLDGKPVPVVMTVSVNFRQ